MSHSREGNVDILECIECVMIDREEKQRVRLSKNTLEDGSETRVAWDSLNMVHGVLFAN